jgi:hypothetical protein
MPIQLDEKTEITLPLKIVVGLGVALVSAVAFVLHIESRIDVLDSTIARKSIVWDSTGKFVAEFKPHPLVNETAERVRQMELEMIRQQKDIEYLKEQLKKKSL